LLRPFRADDLAAFEEFAATPEYLRYLGERHPTPSELVSNNVNTNWDEQPGWVIELAGVPVGSVFLGLAGQDPGEVACLVAPRYWRRGIASEATSAVVSQAFAANHLTRVWARCHPDNRASIATLVSLGFVRAENSEISQSSELRFEMERPAG
jgi:ribosomal-protein-alanine N-acetyltransferase